MVNDKDSFIFHLVDVCNFDHQKAIIELMNEYMLDRMGLMKEMPVDFADKLISGISQQNNYLGFLLQYQDKFIALANCFIGYSTFQAEQLINIHDFIVSAKYRNMGAGNELLTYISQYALKNSFCKITLEVRTDNDIAQRLYKKAGFQECTPSMLFWQRKLKKILF